MADCKRSKVICVADDDPIKDRMMISFVKREMEAPNPFEKVLDISSHVTDAIHWASARSEKQA